MRDGLLSGSAAGFGGWARADQGSSSETRITWVGVGRGQLGQK